MAKKKRAVRRRSDAKPTAGISPAAVQNALDILEQQREAVAVALSLLDDSGEMPAHLIEVAALCQNAQDPLAGISKVWKAKASAMREAGSFARGRYAVSFKLERGAVRPKWKDVAVAQHRQVCQSMEQPFDAKAFEKSVKDATEPGPDTYKPEIVEVA